MLLHRPSKEDLIAMKSGMSYSAIARELCVGRTTVHRWINKVETERGPDWKPPVHNPDRKYCVMPPCFRERMRQVEAGYITLAEASGISTTVIRKALSGRRICRRNAAYLFEAVNTRTFIKGRQGRRL